jgi:hypothetical protein
MVRHRGGGQGEGKLGSRAGQANVWIFSAQICMDVTIDPLVIGVKV